MQLQLSAEGFNHSFGSFISGMIILLNYHHDISGFKNSENDKQITGLTVYLCSSLMAETDLFQDKSSLSCTLLVLYYCFSEDVISSFQCRLKIESMSVLSFFYFKSIAVGQNSPFSFFCCDVVTVQCAAYGPFRLYLRKCQSQF